MFILVVDDLRIFAAPEDAVIHHARTSADALTFLEENFGMISEIWFDHDLGGTDDVMSVVRWLEEKAVNGEANHITAIRIVTDNPVGYQKIAWLGQYFHIAPKPNHIGLITD